MARKPLDSNFTIVAPIIGPEAPRPDLNQYRPPKVLEVPLFPNAHLAIMAQGKEWVLQGLDRYDVAKVGQYLGGTMLSGKPLEILASHSDEVYDQFHRERPEATG